MGAPVLVVGGGPAGMEAAVRARRAGHPVRLVEQRDVLGGQLDIAAKCSSTWVRADACRLRSAQWSAPSHVSGMWTSLPKDTWIDGAVPDARHWCGTPRGT